MLTAVTAFRDRMADSGVSRYGVAIMGTTPPGCSGVYATIVDVFKQHWSGSTGVASATTGCGLTRDDVVVSLSKPSSAATVSPPSSSSSLPSSTPSSPAGLCQCIVLLDGYRDVSSLLASGAVFVLKINVAELFQLAASIGWASPTTGPAGADGLVGLDRTTAVASAASFVFRQFPVAWLAITDGAARAHLFSRDDVR